MITADTPHRLPTTSVVAAWRAWVRGDLAVAHTTSSTDTLLSTFPVDHSDRCSAGCDGPGSSVVRLEVGDLAHSQRASLERESVGTASTTAVRGAGGTNSESTCGVDHHQIIPGEKHSTTIFDREGHTS